MIEQLGNWQATLTLVAFLFAVYLLVMWAAAVIWTYRDIQARTTDPFQQAASVLVVAIFNIPGLILHVLMRPKTTIDEQMDRRLEAEAMFQDIHERPACPQCAARVQPEFILCPLCRAELRTPCGGCGQALAIEWVMCPYCTTERKPAPATAPRRSAAGGTMPGLRAARPAFAGGHSRG